MITFDEEKVEKVRHGWDFPSSVYFLFLSSYVMFNFSHNFKGVESTGRFAGLMIWA